MEGSSQDCEARERRTAEEELLSMPLTPSFPSRLETTIESLHAGNIIACRFNCDGTLIASGGADRVIKIICGESYRSVRLDVSRNFGNTDSQLNMIQGASMHRDSFSSYSVTFLVPHRQVQLTISYDRDASMNLNSLVRIASVK